MKEIKYIFKQILIIATQMGVLKIGNVSFDGTKIRANATKHKAMSYAYAQKSEKQIQKEVDQLLEKAQDVDIEDEENGLNIRDLSFSS